MRLTVKDVRTIIAEALDPEIGQLPQQVTITSVTHRKETDASGIEQVKTSYKTWTGDRDKINQTLIVNVVSRDDRLAVLRNEVPVASDILRDLKHRGVVAVVGGGGSLPKQARVVRSGPRKATYKIYGRLKGAKAHTRLMGKAYLAPDDTSFKPGELAGIEPIDGKLQVRKSDGDHSQVWEPET